MAAAIEALNEQYKTSAEDAEPGAEAIYEFRLAAQAEGDESVKCWKGKYRCLSVIEFLHR